MSDPNIPKIIGYRLQYTDGMFLTAADMALEQAYFVNMAALQNRLLYTSGVLAGLLVTKKSATQLQIAPGAGLDEAGHLVVLPGDGVMLEVTNQTDSPSTIYLAYPDGGTRQGMPPNQVNMAGVAQIVSGAAPATGAPPAIPHSIVLAEIDLSSEHAISTVADKRVPVAGRLPATLDLTGTVTIAASDLPKSGEKSFPVYYVKEKTPAFPWPPRIDLQVKGSSPYSVSSRSADPAKFSLVVTAPQGPPPGAESLEVAWTAFS